MINYFTQGNRPWWCRILTAAVCFVFCANTAVYPQGPVHFDPSHQADMAVPLPEKIIIPKELGTIEARARGNGNGNGNGQNIIFIRDAHAVEDAQANIETLIRHLEEHYHIDVVALEGGEGEIDPTLFRTFPEPGVKRKVLSGYRARGELSGAEMAAIFNSREAFYFGIESWGLYEQNYWAYITSSRNRPAILEALEGREQAMDERRRALYSSELDELHERAKAFREGRAHLLEFLTYLKRQGAVSRDRFPDLSVLFSSIEEESHFDTAQLDLSIRSLADAFQENHAKRLAKEKAMEWNAAYQDLLTGASEARLFLDFLVKFSREAGEPVELEGELKSFLEHGERLAQLKGTKLFHELELFIRDLEERRIRNKEERELRDEYQRLFLLRDLAKLELSRDEWQTYQKELARYEALLEDRTLLEPALEFYRFAVQRDRALHENLVKLLKSRKAKSAIVVLGGFHTEGFEENLAREGFSYAVVTPKIPSLRGHERYEEVMGGKVSYRTNLQSTFYDGFVRHSTVKLVQELNEPNFRRVLKAWRDNVIRKLAERGRLDEAREYTRYIDFLVEIYIKKYGAKNLTTKSREEILKDIEEELEKFQERALDQLWERVQFQVGKFADGLQLLIKEKRVTAENLRSLLNEAATAKPSGLAIYLALGRGRFTRGEINRFLSGEDAAPDLARLIPLGRAADVRSALETVVGPNVTPAMAREAARFATARPEVVEAVNQAIERGDQLVAPLEVRPEVTPQAVTSALETIAPEVNPRATALAVLSDGGGGEQATPPSVPLVQAAARREVASTVRGDKDLKTAASLGRRETRGRKRIREEVQLIGVPIQSGVFQSLNELMENGVFEEESQGNITVALERIPALANQVARENRRTLRVINDDPLETLAAQFVLRRVDLYRRAVDEDGQPFTLPNFVRQLNERMAGEFGGYVLDATGASLGTVNDLRDLIRNRQYQAAVAMVVGNENLIFQYYEDEEGLLDRGHLHALRDLTGLRDASLRDVLYRVGLSTVIVSQDSYRDIILRDETGFIRDFARRGVLERVALIAALEVALGFDSDDLIFDDELINNPANRKAALRRIDRVSKRPENSEQGDAYRPLIETLSTLESSAASLGKGLPQVASRQSALAEGTLMTKEPRPVSVADGALPEDFSSQGAMRLASLSVEDFAAAGDIASRLSEFYIKGNGFRRDALTSEPLVSLLGQYPFASRILTRPFLKQIAKRLSAAGKIASANQETDEYTVFPSVPHPFELSYDLAAPEYEQWMRRILSRNVYWEALPEEGGPYLDRSEIIDRLKLLGNTVERVRRWAEERYGKENVASIYIKGSYILGFQYIPPGDMDITVVLKGEHGKIFESIPWEVEPKSLFMNAADRGYDSVTEFDLTVIGSRYFTEPSFANGYGPEEKVPRDRIYSELVNDWTTAFILWGKDYARAPHPESIIAKAVELYRLSGLELNKKLYRKAANRLLNAILLLNRGIEGLNRQTDKQMAPTMPYSIGEILDPLGDFLFHQPQGSEARVRGTIERNRELVEEHIKSLTDYFDSLDYPKLRKRVLFRDIIMRNILLALDAERKEEAAAPVPGTQPLPLVTTPTRGDELPSGASLPPSPPAPGAAGGASLGLDVLNAGPSDEWDEALRQAGVWQEGVDFDALLRDQDVLVIGDTNHNFLGVQRGLVEHLVELRNAGVTHLFLELSSNYRLENIADIAQSTWIPHVFRELVERAMKLGFQVEFMDMPRSERNPSWSENETSYQRGVYMGNRISQRMVEIRRTNPDARFAAVTGYGHIQDGLQIPEQLRANGIHAGLLAIVSEGQYGGNILGEEIPLFELSVVSAVRRVAREGQRYGYVDLRGFNAGIEGVIHFPRPQIRGVDAKPMRFAGYLEDAALAAESTALVSRSVRGALVIPEDQAIAPLGLNFEPATLGSVHTWPTQNEEKLISLIAGLQGLSNGQKFYLTSLLHNYARNVGRHSLGGAIEALAYSPDRQVVTIVTVDTFGKTGAELEALLRGAPQLRQHREVSLRTLQEQFGYPDLFMDQIPPIEISNNPERPLAALNMVPLIFAALRHPGRIGISSEMWGRGTWLRVYNADVSRAATPRGFTSLAELTIDDFQLNEPEQGLKAAQHLLHGIDRLVTSLLYSDAGLSEEFGNNVGRLARIMRFVPSSKQAQGRLAYEQLDRVSFAVHGFEGFDRNLDRTILEARKELRYVNADEFRRLISQLDDVIRPVQTAVTTIESLFNRYADLSQRLDRSGQTARDYLTQAKELLSTLQAIRTSLDSMQDQVGLPPAELRALPAPPTRDEAGASGSSLGGVTRGMPSKGSDLKGYAEAELRRIESLLALPEVPYEEIGTQLTELHRRLFLSVLSGVISDTMEKEGLSREELESRLTVFFTGSIGRRRELVFGSDIDYYILSATEVPEDIERARAITREVYRGLQELGVLTESDLKDLFDPYSVKTMEKLLPVDQISPARGGTPVYTSLIRTTLLDTEFAWGNRQAYEDLLTEAHSKLLNREMAKKLWYESFPPAGTDLDSVIGSRPLKEQSIRIFQNFMWIMKAVHHLAGASSFNQLIQDLVSLGKMRQSEAEAVTKAYSYLLRLRSAFSLLEKEIGERWYEMSNEEALKRTAQMIGLAPDTAALRRQFDETLLPAYDAVERVLTQEFQVEEQTYRDVQAKEDEARPSIVQGLFLFASSVAFMKQRMGIPATDQAKKAGTDTGGASLGDADRILRRGGGAFRPMSDLAYGTQRIELQGPPGLSVEGLDKLLTLVLDDMAQEARRLGTFIPPTLIQVEDAMLRRYNSQRPDERKRIWDVLAAQNRLLETAIRDQVRTYIPEGQTRTSSVTKAPMEMEMTAKYMSALASRLGEPSTESRLEADSLLRGTGIGFSSSVGAEQMGFIPDVVIIMDVLSSVLEAARQRGDANLRRLQEATGAVAVPRLESILEDRNNDFVIHLSALRLLRNLGSFAEHAVPSIESIALYYREGKDQQRAARQALDAIVGGADRVALTFVDPQSRAQLLKMASDAMGSIRKPVGKIPAAVTPSAGTKENPLQNADGSRIRNLSEFEAALRTASIDIKDSDRTISVRLAQYADKIATGKISDFQKLLTSSSSGQSLGAGLISVESEKEGIQNGASLGDTPASENPIASSIRDLENRIGAENTRKLLDYVDQINQSRQTEHLLEVDILPLAVEVADMLREDLKLDWEIPPRHANVDVADLKFNIIKAALTFQDPRAIFAPHLGPVVGVTKELLPRDKILMLDPLNALKSAIRTVSRGQHPVFTLDQIWNREDPSGLPGIFAGAVYFILKDQIAARDQAEVEIDTDKFEFLRKILFQLNYRIGLDTSYEWARLIKSFPDTEFKDVNDRLIQFEQEDKALRNQTTWHNNKVMIRRAAYLQSQRDRFEAYARRETETILAQIRAPYSQDTLVTLAKRLREAGISRRELNHYLAGFTWINGQGIYPQRLNTEVENKIAGFFGLDTAVKQGSLRPEVKDDLLAVVTTVYYGASNDARAFSTASATSELVQSLLPDKVPGNQMVADVSHEIGNLVAQWQAGYVVMDWGKLKELDSQVEKANRDFVERIIPQLVDAVQRRSFLDYKGVLERLSYHEWEPEEGQGVPVNIMTGFVVQRVFEHLDQLDKVSAENIDWDVVEQTYRDALKKFSGPVSQIEGQALGKQVVKVAEDPLGVLLDRSPEDLLREVERRKLNTRQDIILFVTGLVQKKFERLREEKLGEAGRAAERIGELHKERDKLLQAAYSGALAGEIRPLVQEWRKLGVDFGRDEEGETQRIVKAIQLAVIGEAGLMARMRRAEETRGVTLSREEIQAYNRALSKVLAQFVRDHPRQRVYFGVNPRSKDNQVMPKVLGELRDLMDALVFFYQKSQAGDLAGYRKLGKPLLLKPIDRNPERTLQEAADAASGRLGLIATSETIAPGQLAQEGVIPFFANADEIPEELLEPMLLTAGLLISALALLDEPERRKILARKQRFEAYFKDIPGFWEFAKGFTSQNGLMGVRVDALITAIKARAAVEMAA